MFRAGVLRRHMENHVRVGAVLRSFLPAAFFAAGAIFISPCCMGQEREPEPPVQDAGIPQDQEQEAEADASTRGIYQQDQQTESMSQRSFSGGVFADWRNPFGFSMGAYEIYVRDSYPTLSQRGSTMITSLYPQLFANFGRRRSKLHLNYGFGYGFENRDVSNDTQEHSANASYTYRVARKTSLEIRDFFFSSPNYYGSILRPIIGEGGGQLTPPFWGEAYRPGQRMLRNDLTASIDQQLSRKVSLGLFGTYHTYRYEQSSYYDGDGFSAGVRLSYQPKKWLSISSSYSRYLNRVDERFKDATINRVEIGEFDFRLSRAWRLRFSGGVEITDYYGSTRTYGSWGGSLVRSSRYNTFSASYRHGLTSAIGLSRIYQSDILSLDFSQRISRRVALLVGSSYWRNRDLVAGRYDYWLARSGLQFLLLRQLAAVVQYSYQYQTSRYETPADVVQVNRHLVYFGLQYFWPGARRL